MLFIYFSKLVFSYERYMYEIAIVKYLLSYSLKLTLHYKKLPINVCNPSYPRPHTPRPFSALDVLFF